MKVLKDSVIYLFGEVLSKIFPFFLLPYLTRNLSINGFAEYSYLYSLYVLFSIIMLISQDGVISRYYFYYGKRCQPVVFIAGLTISLCIMIAFFVLFNILDMSQYIVICIASLSTSLISVQLRLRQCRKHAISYVKIVLFNTLLTFIFTVSVFELYGGNEYTFFYCLTFSNILVLYLR